MEVTAEQPEQPDDDQVDRNDVIQQARHREDEHAGDQRNQRAGAGENVNASSARLTMGGHSLLFHRHPLRQLGSGELQVFGCYAGRQSAVCERERFNPGKCRACGGMPSRFGAACRPCIHQSGIHQGQGAVS